MKKDDNQDDIVFEEENNEPQESSFQKKTPDAKLAKLEEELARCKAEKEEYLQGWQRAKADYINFKNRSEKERAELKDFILEPVLTDVISVIDNFEMAISDRLNWEKAPESWRKGMEHIYKQMTKILANQKVTEIKAEGQKFDPNHHDAVETVPVEKSSDDGKIQSVIKKGYQMGNRIIRPALVKVGEFKK